MLKSFSLSTLMLLPLWQLALALAFRHSLRLAAKGHSTAASACRPIITIATHATLCLSLQASLFLDQHSLLRTLLSWHSFRLQTAPAPSGAITWLDREAPEPTATGMITHAGPKSDDPLWRD